MIEAMTGAMRVVGMVADPPKLYPRRETTPNKPFVKSLPSNPNRDNHRTASAPHPTTATPLLTVATHRRVLTTTAHIRFPTTATAATIAHPRVIPDTWSQKALQNRTEVERSGAMPSRRYLIGNLRMSSLLLSKGCIRMR